MKRFTSIIIISFFCSTSISQTIEIDTACSYILTPWHQGYGSEDHLVFGHYYGARDPWCFYVIDEFSFVRMLDSDTLDLQSLPILVDHSRMVNTNTLSDKEYWAFSPLGVLHYLDNASFYKIGSQIFSVHKIKYVYMKNIDITINTDVILWEDNYTREKDTIIGVPIGCLRANKDVRLFYYLMEIKEIPTAIREKRWKSRYELIEANNKNSHPNHLNRTL